jgi:cytochrome c6
MKGVCIVVAVVLLAIPIMLWAAEDGAALYAEKCAMCHGEKGQGSPENSMPAVKGISMTAEKLVVYLTKGDSTKTMHANPMADNEAQAKAIAAFVKSMK